MLLLRQRPPKVQLMRHTPCLHLERLPAITSKLKAAMVMVVDGSSEPLVADDKSGLLIVWEVAERFDYAFVLLLGDKKLSVTGHPPETVRNNQSRTCGRKMMLCPGLL